MKDFETRKLQEIDEMKSRFFANISHEFRTPLNLILGPINAMSSRVGGDRNKQDLKMIRRNAQRLSRLINQLLDLSKMETGKATLKTRPENLVKFVESITQLFGSLAEQKQIELTFHLQADSITVFLDRDKMEKIISNLLSNALKFTPNGGSVDVAVSSSKSGFAEVSVTDTGIGIPADRLEKIFDRFYQVDSSSAREWEGTGIGLALTKDFVELHKGQITVTSEPDKGTRFTVSLPLGQDHLSGNEIIDDVTESDRAEPAVELVEPGEDIQPESIREDDTTPRTDTAVPVILVVEDNVDMRIHIRDVLGPNYSIIEARDGSDGLDQAVANVPDLIISDVMMPNIDGMDLCHKLKTDERISHIPVILLTAKAGMENKVEGLETGADDYINKPFEAQELQVRVRRKIPAASPGCY
jgi:CheY-like chemotaxis protein